MRRTLATLTWMGRVFAVLACSAIVLSAVVIALEVDLLSSVSPLLDESAVVDNSLSSTIDVKEQRLLSIDVPRRIFAVAAAVVWLGWVYGAARLLRLCKIDGLEFRPFMTIVWQFIPVMNLWKPLEINIEIASASKGRDDWKAARPSGLTILTSFLLTAAALMGKANYELGNKINDVADAVSAIRFDIVFEIILIASLATTVAFVVRAHKDQKRLVSGTTDPVPSGFRE